MQKNREFILFNLDEVPTGSGVSRTIRLTRQQHAWPSPLKPSFITALSSRHQSGSNRFNMRGALAATAKRLKALSRTMIISSNLPW